MCRLAQHGLILRLARLRPCRVVGDPLQAVFGFDRNDPLPDWDRDVVPEFERLPDLVEPHRWLRDGTNRALGEWLANLRNELSRASWRIAFRDGAPVRWVRRTSQDVKSQRGACFALNDACGSDLVVAIHNQANQQHYVAKSLGGCFQSMEEVEGKELMKYCGFLEDSVGFRRASRVVELACKCMVRTPKYLSAIKVALAKGRIPTKGKIASDCAALLAALEAVAAEQSYSAVGECLDIIEHSPGVVLYRREPPRDLAKACRLHDPESGGRLRTTAWKARDVVRRQGRRLPRRLVSRTLLIKGLEFDHAVVLDADGITDARNLHVALTRATKSLTVVSTNPLLMCTSRQDSLPQEESGESR